MAVAEESLKFEAPSTTWHSKMILDCLWKSYQTKNGPDFNFRWGGRSVRVHRFVLDAFLRVPKTLRRSQAQSADVLDSLLEFLYRGHVSVAKERRQELLDAARELDFKMLVDAIEERQSDRYGIDLNESEKEISVTSSVAVRCCYVNIEPLLNFPKQPGQAKNAATHAKASLPISEVTMPGSDIQIKGGRRKESPQMAYDCPELTSKIISDEDVEGESENNHQDDMWRYEDGLIGSVDLTMLPCRGQNDTDSDSYDEIFDVEELPPRSKHSPTPGTTLTCKGVPEIDPLACQDLSRDLAVSGSRIPNSRRISVNAVETVTKTVRRELAALSGESPEALNSIVTKTPKKNSRRKNVNVVQRESPTAVIKYLNVNGKGTANNKLPDYGAKRSSLAQNANSKCRKLVDKCSHSCTKCHKRFVSRFLLKLHKRTHGRTIKQFHCQSCTFKSTSRVALVQHLTNVHGPGCVPLPCHKCGIHCSSEIFLQRHQRTHLRRPAEKKHKCPDCDFSSARFSGIRRHRMAQHHPSRTKVFRCPHCSFQSPQQKDLTLHLKAVHALEQRPFKCPQCDSSFNLEGSLIAHAHDAHGVGPKYFACDVCGKRCASQSELLFHCRTHDLDDLKCSLCVATFCRSDHLKRHLADVHGQSCEQYACEKCGKLCESSAGLASHCRTHGPRKLLQCKLCSFTASRRHVLVQHQSEAHELVSPGVLACQVCGRLFATLLQLRKHGRTHKGPTFKCRYCEFACHHSSEFDMHVFLVHCQQGT